MPWLSATQKGTRQLSRLRAQAMFGSFRERLCLESLHGLRPARLEEANARMETSVMMLGAPLLCASALRVMLCFTACMA